MKNTNVSPDLKSKTPTITDIQFINPLKMQLHLVFTLIFSDLFQLISTNETADHKQLAILFYELIQIPKFLGESAVFGGTNVEPSVRSCFSLSHFPNTVRLDDFLKWLKMEPQSFIWLPVLHRLANSENIKHEVSCRALLTV